MHSHSPSVSARLIQKRKWLRLGIATLTSTALVGGTLVPVPTNSFFQHSLVAEAAAQEAVLSHAEGQVIDLSLLRDFVHPEDMGIFDGLVEAIQAQQSFTGNENNSPETSQLDVEALQAIRLNLGGITLPLVDDGSGNGLLQLGTDGIGVLSAYASAPDATSAHAAAGVVDEDGAINLDPTQGAGNVETNLQLTAVLNQLGLGPVTDTIADDLALRLGAVSSMAQAEGGEVTSEYAVANAELYLHSPLVEEVGGLVKPGGLGEDLDNVVNGLLGEDGLVGGQIVGLVSGLLSTLRLGNIELNATTNLEATLDELLGQPLTSEDELVTIDLQSGEVKVNLEKLHGDNLSNLEPNTPLVNAEQLTRITSTVDGLLDSLSQRITDTLNNGVLDTRLVIEISLLGGLVGKTRIDGTLSQILAGTAPVTGGGLLGVLLNPLVNGLVNGLGPILGNVDEDGNLQVTILNDIIGNLLTPVNALLGDGSVLGLSGLIDEVLGEVAQVTINSQPNELIAAQGSVDGRPNARRGTLTDPSEDFSVVPVRAQVLRLGTDGGVVDLPLARSTVKATDIDDPILNAPELLDIDPNQGPRSGGNEVTLTGTNLADIDTIYVNETAITVFELDAEAGTVTFVAPAWADLDTTEDEVEVSVATNGVRSKSLGYTYVDDVPGAADHNPGYEWVNIKAGETLVIDQTKDTGLPDGMNFEINPEFDGPSGWDFTITDPATGALEITAPDDAAPGMVFRVPVIATYPDGTTDDLSARVNVVMTPFEIVETIPGDTSITIRFSDGTVIEVPYGEAGQDGQDGQDGLTPQVGENGNWWIGEIDTGVPATGADGEDGADGESVEIVSKTVDPETRTITIAFSDGNTIVIRAGQDGADGEDGESLTVVDYYLNVDGDLVIEFSDESTVIVPKGADGADGSDGESVTITDRSVDADGNIVIEFSDGTIVTIPKGEKGDQGVPGQDGKSAYELWLEAGNVGDINDFLESLKGADGQDGNDGAEGQPGVDGKSAYELWLEAGNEGDVDDFLESLIGQPGADGKSAYDLWIEDGNSGSKQDFLDSLKGDQGVPGQDGKSAYELWLEAGNVGDINDFLESLKGADGQDGNDGADGQPGVNGKSAYELWIEAGNKGDVDDFLESLIGERGADGKSVYELWIEAGNSGSEEDFLDSLKGEKGDQGEPGQDGQDGLTPHVGENNNWWIGETDTGVSATGPTGPAGESVTVKGSSTDADGNIVIEFSDGNTVVIPAGQDGKDGDSITVVGSELNADGDLEIEFSDGTTVTVPKGADGEDGESVTITDTSVDTDGNTVIEFSDGTTVVVAKGDKGDQGEPGKDGENGQNGTGSSNAGIGSGSSIGKCTTEEAAGMIALLGVLGAVGIASEPAVSDFLKKTGNTSAEIFGPLKFSGPNRPAWLVSVDHALARVGTSVNELAGPFAVVVGLVAALGAINAACAPGGNKA